MADTAEHDKPDDCAARLDCVEGEDLITPDRNTDWDARARSAGAWLLSATLALAGELFAVVAGLAIFVIFASNALLTRQSTDLGAFRPTVKRLVAQAFDGADADFETLALEWFPSTDTLSFNAENITVVDANGNTVQTLARLKAGLQLDGVLDRRPDLRELEVVGGEVTWLERADGTVVAGLGTPQTVGAFGPVFRGRDADAGKAAPDRAGWIEAFRSVSIKDSTVHVMNENNDLSLRLAVDSLKGSIDGDAVTLTVAGRALNPDTQAPDGRLDLTVRSPDRLQTLSVEGEIGDLRLDRVAPRDGRFRVLRAAQLPLSLSGSGIYSREAGLRALSVDLNARSGAVDIAGKKRGVRSARLAASLDPGEQVVTIRRLQLAADRIDLDGAGFVRELGNIQDGDVGTSPEFDLRFDTATLDMTPTLRAPLALRSLAAKGQVDLDSRTLSLGRLRVEPAGYVIDLAGTVTSAVDGLSEVKLSGRTEGKLSAEDLMALWPVSFAGGAQRWIDRSIEGGALSNLSFEVDLDEAFFDSPALTEERLQVAFDVQDGVVRYIETMPVLTGARASARIAGNTLDLDLSEGRIGDVVLSGGKVSIPRLLPKGGDIIISADAAAPTESLLRLIDNPPFQYMQRYGVDPNGFGGTGDIALTVRRPLLEFFEPERIEYAVEGTFTDASAPFQMGGFGLTDADVSFRGGKAGLFLEGPANVGPWRANISWEERYGQNGEPTRYGVSGRMDAAVLDAFGLGVRQIMGGEVDVVASATGRGLSVDTAVIDVDLSDADLSFGQFWSKTRGRTGTVSAAVTRADGGFRFERMDVDAPGLRLQGTGALRENLSLRSATFSTVAVDDFIAGSGTVTRVETPDGPTLDVDLSGSRLDISPYVDRALRREGDPIAVPFDLNAEFASVILAEGYALSDTVLSVVSMNGAVKTLVLAGERPSGPLTASVVSNETSREASIRVPDMSDALRAVYGLESTRGGAVALDATLPLPEQPGATIGRIVVDDFDLVRAPFLAQLLSMASLTGLFDTLGGSGLSFDGMEADFALRDRTLSVRDARMSGPALGMTLEGELDFDRRTLDVEGAIAPAYTANSALSELPLIGDIFTDKDGEGVFALTYTIAGPFESAQLAVNPLSALTPGFLRGIFRKDREDLPEGVTPELAEQISAVRPPAPVED